MAELKLTKLPDRTPVKLAINVTPALYRRLQDYALAYAETYQAEEPIADLVPAILAGFLESDKAFLRWCRDSNGRTE